MEELCDCTLDDIARFCGEPNAPGLKKLLSIACLDEVTSIPDPVADSHKITANIVMRAAVSGSPGVAAGKFHRWYFAAEDASYSCTKDDNGLYKTELKLFVEKLTDGKSYTFSGISGDNYLVLFEDLNAEGMRLVGDEENGVRVSVKEQTNPKNGYEVTITHSGRTIPYWYTGTVTY